MWTQADIRADKFVGTQKVCRHKMCANAQWESSCPVFVFLQNPPTAFLHFIFPPDLLVQNPPKVHGNFSVVIFLSNNHNFYNYNISPNHLSILTALLFFFSPS